LAKNLTSSISLKNQQTKDLKENIIQNLKTEQHLFTDELLCKDNDLISLNKLFESLSEKREYEVEKLFLRKRKRVKTNKKL